MEEETKYEKRGVSSEKTDVKNAIKNLDKGLYPKAFCKIIPDILNDKKKTLFGPSYCNVMHADGAGTKSTLAYLYWKETGDLSVWKGIAQDAIVMNIDDLLCVGVSDNMVLSSTIGRNKFRIPAEVISTIIEGTQEFVEHMAKHKINMSFAGGETADVGDIVRTIIVDSTVSARIKRNDVISCDRIQAGDVIIGLASYGKAKYETFFNSGIGSNGLTSAKHDVLSNEYAEKYPETYDDLISKDLVYTGSLKLTDPSGIEGLDVGKMLLSPTRTYAPAIKAILDNYRPSIHGIVHCSGGGQTKVMNFIDGIHVLKTSMFEIPTVFNTIQKESGTTWHEMYKVFNMGHRMELYVKENIASDIIKICNFFDIDAQIIGHCEGSSQNRLTIEGEHGKFDY